jgi:hypothetical protein
VLDRAQMLELLDLPATFPLLWDIMGWNIQLYISPLSIKRPEPRPAAGPLPPAAGYHQDSGRPRLEMQWDHAKAGETQDEREMVGTGTTPMLALKIAYFLTDTTVPDCGAMRVIPGTPGIGPSPSMRPQWSFPYISLVRRPRHAPVRRRAAPHAPVRRRASATPRRAAPGGHRGALRPSALALSLAQLQRCHPQG